jgi:cytochrome c peroxidase
MNKRLGIVVCALLLAAALVCGSGPVDADSSTSGLLPADNHAGTVASAHTTGVIDFSNPFFQPLGTNPHTCATCHDPTAGWTLTPTFVRQKSDRSDGLDPLFNLVDNGNGPNGDVSTLNARRATFSLNLRKALIRFTTRIAATAEFAVGAVDDPYSCATPDTLFRYRRPNPTANAAHSTSITWTGVTPDIRTALKNLMRGAASLHEQRVEVMPDDIQNAGADFMLGLSFAQTADKQAGALDVVGAEGGPVTLATEPFYMGINGFSSDPVTGLAFDPVSLTIFDVWEDLDTKADKLKRDRAWIAEGGEVFYTKQFDISGVAGLNDVLGQPTIRGTYTTCHNTPQVGSNSQFVLMNTGTADGARRPADLPLITLRNKATGEIQTSTDLGRAISTGQWADVGKFKPPQLRGLAARAPFFHDGSAERPHDVVTFYKERFHIDFHIDFQGDEEANLVRCLEAL